MSNLLNDHPAEAVHEPLVNSMTIYDLCLAWEWEYDTDFVQLLNTVCQSQGLSLLQVTPQNLEATLTDLMEHQVSFRAFMDRASDANESFLPLIRWVREQPIFRINPHRLARLAWDKAAMHLAFSSAGLQTPPSVIIPSHLDQPILPPIDTTCLGSCFSIKPAHGGGGKGVITAATNWEQVLIARQEFPEDQYLLQAYIIPAELNSRQAWFRVIYCAGEVFPCWWDTQTHYYNPITSSDEACYNLQPLREMATTIARISNLHLFSTEIAQTNQNQLVVVDYINDPIDLRLQSKHFEGVPDYIVEAIAKRLVSIVATF